MMEQKTWNVVCAFDLGLHLTGNNEPIDQRIYSDTFHPEHTDRMKLLPLEHAGGTRIEMVMQPSKPSIEPCTDCKDKKTTGNTTNCIKVTSPALGLQVNAVVSSNPKKANSTWSLQLVESSELHLVFVQTMDCYQESRAYGADRSPTSYDFYMNFGSIEQGDRHLPVLDAHTEGNLNPFLPYYSASAETSFDPRKIVSNDKGTSTCAEGKIALVDAPCLRAPLAVFSTQPNLCKFLSGHSIQGSVFYLKELKTSLTFTSWLCFASSEEKLLYPLLTFRRYIEYEIQVTEPASIAKEFKYDFINTPDKQRMPVLNRAVGKLDQLFPKGSLIPQENGRLYFANKADFSFEPSISRANIAA